ncbi:MAG: glycosyltransferase [Candidatus Wallbacteria bacterium]|nr:glycosyltransferase [Candidatus Wallbacteria bacterium]
MTIAVIVYNCAKYLPIALESALAQTHGNLELLVLDDASTDGSLDIIKSFQARDDRVRLEVNPTNQGMGAARGRSVQDASSEWVLVLDADDRLLPDCIETQLGVAAGNPDAKVISGRSHYISSSGERIGASTVFPLSRKRLAELIEQSEPFAFMHSRTLLHRSTVLEVGNYRAQMRTCDDVDLWVRLAERGHLILTHSAFVAEYRKHPQASAISTGLRGHLWYYWIASQMRNRKNGRPEGSLEDFEAAQKRLPLLEKLEWWRCILREQLYREAGMLSGERAWMGVAWRLALAFAIAPDFVARRLWNRTFGG